MNRNYYKDYLKEREGGCYSLEKEYGFTLFKFDQDQCLICDQYVAPKFRRNGYAHAMADSIRSICKNENIRVMICQSDEEACGHEAAQASIQSYGFKEFKREGSLILYMIEV